MSRIIRWVFTAISTILILPIIVANIQKLLEVKHWDEFLLGWWPTMPDFSYFVRSRWLLAALIFSGGVATALWVIKLWQEKRGVSSFKWQRGMIPLKEAAQNLYDELMISNIRSVFEQGYVSFAESHEQVLNNLGEMLAEEGIVIYGTPPNSNKMIEIKNLSLKLCNMEFNNGAYSLCDFNKSPQYIDLHVNKKEVRRAIDILKEKMPDLLTLSELQKTQQSNEKIEIQETIIKAAPLLVRSEVVKVKHPQNQSFGGIIWAPNLIDLRVAIENPTNNDYQNMDITLRPDFPNAYIKAIGQISNIPGVTFVSNEIQLLGLDQNGNPIIKFASATGHTKGDGCKIITHGNKSIILPNFYRVLIEKLYRRTTIEITFAIPKEFISDPDGRINNIWLTGRYYVDSNQYDIDQTMPVAN